MRAAWLIGVAGLLWLLPQLGRAQTVPEGYPAEYKDTVAAAQKEGKVVVYSTTDAASAEPLLKGFRALYPGIQIEYNDLNSSEIYNRFIAEAAANSGTGDLLWSSAMDLQVKLVAEGYAQPYQSPEAAKLPGWAVYQNQAYGTTLEPVVFAYNKRLLPADAVPKTHADFARLLKEKAPLLTGKVTLYDPEKSGLGFLFVTQDSMLYPGFWDLAALLGADQARYYTSSGAMIEKILSGEHLLGYDIIGSYVALRMKKDADLAMVYPEDYMLAFSRVAFISKAAKQPNAAKLFLDYILSKKAQEIMANDALLFSIRSDVEGPATAAVLNQQLGDRLKPIAVGAGLLDYLAPTKRLPFMKQWQQTARTK